MRMKQFKYFLFVAIFSLFMIGKTSTSYAGADTVKYRKIIGILSDSTRIQYEIGSFGLKQTGGLKYLSFYSSTESPSTYFKTNNFVISGSNDSISFMSFANFDDKHFAPARSDLDTGTTAFYNWIDSLATKYAQFFVSPNSSAFSSSSSILFILEVRKSSDGSVLSRLDTTKCYLNASGQIVYKNYPRSVSIRNRKISGVSNGDDVFFNVSIVKSLPSSGDFIGYDYTDVNANYAAVQDPQFTQEIVDPPPPIKELVVQKAGIISEIKVIPNPFNGNMLRFAITDLPNRRDGKLRVFNNIGSLVVEQPINVGAGETGINVSIPHLASGAYTLELNLNNKYSRASFIIIQ